MNKIGGGGESQNNTIKSRFPGKCWNWIFLVYEKERCHNCQCTLVFSENELFTLRSTSSIYLLTCVTALSRENLSATTSGPPPHNMEVDINLYYSITWKSFKFFFITCCWVQELSLPGRIQKCKTCVFLCACDASTFRHCVQLLASYYSSQHYCNLMPCVFE